MNSKGNSSIGGSDNNQRETRKTSYLALGIALGLMFGAAFKNIALGLMFGVVTGIIMDSQKNRRK